MSVSINLPPDVENAIREHAASHGQDVESYLRTIVTERIHDEELSATTPAKVADLDQWLTAWIALHPQSHPPIDDSRESIYEGRGE